MRFVVLIAFAVAISLMGAAACGGDEGQEGTAHEPAPAAPTANSSTPALSPSTPTASAGGTVPAEIETAAREFLADQLGVDGGGFKLENSEGVAWSDTSLGCPEEGMAYAQVITPGYRLVFDLAGTPYSVHTNSDGSHMATCEGGQ